MAAGGVRRLPALPLSAGRRAHAVATGPGRDALSLSISCFCVIAGHHHRCAEPQGIGCCGWQVGRHLAIGKAGLNSCVGDGRCVVDDGFVGGTACHCHSLALPLAQLAIAMPDHPPDPPLFAIAIAMPCQTTACHCHCHARPCHARPQLAMPDHCLPCQTLPCPCLAMPDLAMPLPCQTLPCQTLSCHCHCHARPLFARPQLAFASSQGTTACHAIAIAMPDHPPHPTPRT